MLLKKATSALLELYMCTTSTLRYELVSAGRYIFFKSSGWTEGEGGDLRGGEQLTSVSVLV